MIESGYLSSSDIYQEAFTARKLHASLKLTRKSKEILSDPINIESRILIPAVRFISDEIQSKYSNLFSLTKSGELRTPLSNVLHQSTVDGISLKLSSYFNPIRSTERENADSCKASKLYDEAQSTNNLDAVAGFVDMQAKKSEKKLFKSRPPSHMNIDSDLFRECLAASCKPYGNCRLTKNLVDVSFLQKVTLFKQVFGCNCFLNLFIFIFD